MSVGHHGDVRITDELLNRAIYRLSQNARWQRLVRMTERTTPFLWAEGANPCTIDPSAIVGNAMLNLTSGAITIGKDVTFGHDVTLLAASHEYHLFGQDRQQTMPSSGYDIVVEEGAWLCGRVTVVGPCRIGAHAVVAAGAVVTADVEPYAIVAGVPARQIGSVEPLTAGGTSA